MTDRQERATQIDQAGDRTAGSLPARYGRRALLLGAAAGGAGVAASLAGGGQAGAAPDGSPPVLLGKSNTASGSTNVTSRKGTGLSGRADTNGQAGVSGFNTSPGVRSYGVYGHSVHGPGVTGTSTHGDGVAGTASTVGFSGVAGIDLCPTNGARGVYGQSNFGDAVLGSSPNGVALHGESEHGLALQVQGKASFSDSGVANVPGGQRTTTVSVPGLTTSDVVLATIQRPQTGVFIEGAEPGVGSFVITLSRNASSSLPVAWLVLSQ